MGYIVITYSLSYTTRILQLNRNTVIWAILAASAVWLVVAGWVAAMSDRWGRRRLLILCLSALTMWSLVFFALLDTGSFPLVLLALVVLAALQGAANGPQAALFAELFETHVRYSGISLAYQVGSILGGGVAPFLATALYDIRLSTLPVTGYLALISIVSLGCAFAIRESGPHHQQMSSRTASRPGLHTHE
jgi:MFS family permease